MDSNNNIYGGNTQILPNADHAEQHIYNGPVYMIGSKGNCVVNETFQTNDSFILNMSSYSCSLPEEQKHEILRISYLDLLEQYFERYNVVCVNGEEGVGVTTLLAQFVRHHGQNCVSYFSNSMFAATQEPNVIEQSITGQLYWYVNHDKQDFDIEKSYNSVLATYYNIVLQRLKNRKENMYFVFDGFDEIPQEKIEGIKRLIDSVYMEKGLFVFSGSKEKISKLFRKSSQIKICEAQLARLSFDEVKNCFLSADPSLNDLQLRSLYDISRRGNAHRMTYILHNAVEKNIVEEFLQKDISGESELYEEDFIRLGIEDNELALDLFALLAFVDFLMPLTLASQILRTEEDNLKKLSSQYSEYISIDKNGFFILLSNGFHKFLRRKLKDYKNRIEMMTVEVIEKPEYINYCNYVTPILKSLNMNSQIIKYLNDKTVQKILENKCSQAAYNEQCEYGYEASAKASNEYKHDAIRFALYKSASKEIENNELWDNEIEALLAIGQSEEAMALAQNVYLHEERLKAYLLIANNKETLTDDEFNVVKDNISILVKEIDFENIPSKSLELAPLLLPIDHEAAIGIVDKVAKKYEGKVNLDRVYTLLSMTSIIISDKKGFDIDSDVAASHIRDENLRKFANASKSLFKNDSVEFFLKEVDKLPNNSQKLSLIQMWLPEHESKEGIGKVVLEALKLIVAVSDMQMPKARILNAICQSMHKMDINDMKSAMTHIDALGDSIKYPTVDFIQSRLTIIEKIKDVMPNKASNELLSTYNYIKGIKDLSLRYNCLAMILDKFDSMGKRHETEELLGVTSEQLGNEVVSGVIGLLSSTAFHFKVVEGPIRALVCSYKSIIPQMIEHMNTSESRSRAYSFAAEMYLRQQDKKHFDLRYIFDLLSKTSEEDDYRKDVLDSLSIILLNSDEIRHDSILPILKENFCYFNNIVDVAVRCINYIRIYLWFQKYHSDDTFAHHVKSLLMESWQCIDVKWVKINLGFRMAKYFSRTSIEDAKDMICKCNEIKSQTLLASSSCRQSCMESVELYARSLCNLIKTKMCDDNMIREFHEDTINVIDKSESAALWSEIALEYYIMGKNDKFEEISDRYFSRELSSFSKADQMFVIRYAAPLLFFRSKNVFFTQINQFNHVFADECIRRVICFIISKRTFTTELNIERKAYKLTFSEYCNVVDLLEHAYLDNTIYQTIMLIGQSLQYQTAEFRLSNEQKTTIINRCRSVVDSKLPCNEGIRHDGYKILCHAMIDYANKEFQTNERARRCAIIDNIPNASDRAFIYISMAPFFSKRNDKEFMLKKGINIVRKLECSYDKEMRFDMGIQECCDNNLGYLVPDMAKTAMKCLANNGNMDDHKRLVDLIYLHDPQLAEQLVEDLDQDSARIQYKQKLLQYIGSKKKIENAKKDFKSIGKLHIMEKLNFFSEQYENLAHGKGQLLEIDTIFDDTLKHIFRNGISEAKDAVLYFMETVCLRHKISHNLNDLLLSIHKSIRGNLLHVISLSAGSRDRIKKIAAMSDEIYSERQPGINNQTDAFTFLSEWFAETPGNVLTIIDPYFKPLVLCFIKKLSDIKNSVQIRILTHRQNFDIGEFKAEWYKVSSGIQIPIHITTVGFARNCKDGPLHDRYWIMMDDENDTVKGIKLNSLDSLGVKIGSIDPVTNDVSSTMLREYDKFAIRNIVSYKNEELIYSEVELS